MRNVEAGYWLTHHPLSQWHGWEFHYVLICPRLDDELGATYYAWIYRNMPQAITDYGHVLQYEHAHPGQAAFDDFRDWAMEHTHKLHWQHLAVRLHVNFLGEYLAELNNLQVAAVGRREHPVAFCPSGVATPTVTPESNGIPSASIPASKPDLGSMPELQHGKYP